MQNFTEFTSSVNVFNEELEAFTKKPTKASSKRLRDAINTIKKMATEAKKDLIENDKGLGRKAE